MAPWWPFVALLTVLALAFGVVVYHGYRRPLSRLGRWSGIPKRRKQDGIEPDKTLWDWLNLLGVPLTVALVGIGYSISARQADLEITEKHRITDQKIADDRAMDGALQTYLAAMSVLLTDKGLNEQEPPDHVRNLARAYTMTVLNQVNGQRKGYVIRFLFEAGLVSAPIGTDKPKVAMHDANLREADLGAAKLPGIDLQYANLKSANLNGAILTGADLQHTRLEWADLRGADLRKAHLQMAFMPMADLQMATLQGAHLQKAQLPAANLRDAFLRGANLQETSLLQANLKGAVLDQSQLDDTLTYHDAENLPAGLTPDPRPWR